MPRSNRNGSRTTSRGMSSNQSMAPPPTQHSSQPPAPSGGGGFLSNIASNVTSGISSGVGFGIAQRMVDGIMGPRQMEVRTTEQPPTQPPAYSMPPQASSHPQDLCTFEKSQLDQCLNQNSDFSACQFYFENLKSCQTRS